MLSKPWKLLENAISPPERTQLLHYILEKQPFTLPIDNLPPVHQKITDIVSEHYDLSTCNFVEQWHNSAHRGQKPDHHIDKDEELWNLTGQVRIPLCSAILYLSVLGLKGANLEISTDERPEGVPPEWHILPFKNPDVVVPKEGNLVLLDKGVWHCVTPYISGHRTAFLMNFWDGGPLYNS